MTSNGIIYFLGIGLLLIFGTIIVLGVSKTNDLQLDMDIENKSVMVLSDFQDSNSSGIIIGHVSLQTYFYIFKIIDNIIITSNFRYHYDHNRKLNYQLRRWVYASEIYVQIMLISNDFFSNFFNPVIAAGGLEEWISDGSCDDINNNIPCKFDGGDCCGFNVLKQYCFKCTCIGNFCQTMKK